jgi:hypothetical protein
MCKIIDEDTTVLLEKSVEIMVDEYKNDKELTIFTQIDSEDFYELQNFMNIHNL